MTLLLRFSLAVVMLLCATGHFCLIVLILINVSDAYVVIVGCVCFRVEADVLVNLITCKIPQLVKAGAVSAALLSIAGSQLQTVSMQ